MHDADTVRRLQRRGDLDASLQELRSGNRAPRQPLRQSLTFRHLHDEQMGPEISSNE